MSAGFKGFCTAGVMVMMAGSAMGQDFIHYRTDCKATSAGVVTAAATITTSDGERGDKDSVSLNQSFAISRPDELGYSHFGNVKAKAKANFVEGCRTKANGSIDGQTAFSFKGNTRLMQFIAESRRDHKNKIKRGPSSGGAGAPVKVDTLYQVPQLDAVEVQTPFKLIGPGIVSGTILVQRSDSGGTGGTIIGAWQLWADNNCNCVVDKGDVAIEGDKGIAGPNDQFRNTKSVDAKEGCYVIAYAYFGDSTLSTESSNCDKTGKANSHVEDYLEIFHEIN